VAFITKWGDLVQVMDSLTVHNDICCDSLNNIYVVDVYISRIQKFSFNRNIYFTMGEYGIGNGHV
jgi:hypothetical protein